MGRILLRHGAVSGKPIVVEIDGRAGSIGDSVVNRKVVQTMPQVLVGHGNFRILRIWLKILILRILAGIKNKISGIYTEIRDWIFVTGECGAHVIELGRC